MRYPCWRAVVSRASVIGRLKGSEAAETDGGTISQSSGAGGYQIDVNADYGEFVVSTIVLDDQVSGAVTVNDSETTVRVEHGQGRLRLRLPEKTVISAGLKFTITIRP